MLVKRDQLRGPQGFDTTRIKQDKAEPSLDKSSEQEMAGYSGRLNEMLSGTDPRWKG